MFGSGFGVGLTVEDLRRSPSAESPLSGGELLGLLPRDAPAGLRPEQVTERPSRLGEVLPPSWRSDAELAVELQRAVRARAQIAAYESELVVELAARRPNCLDVPAGRPGAAAPAVDGEGRPELLAEASEFFADELALICNCSRTAATTLAVRAHTLLGPLRATWEALADGRLDWPRARTIAEELERPCRETDPRTVLEVEAAVLPAATGLSIPRLRAAIRRELFARDPTAAERRRKNAERTVDVELRPAADGMALLLAFLPRPRAQAIWDTVDTLARQARAGGDTRPLGRLRAAILEELVTRPWDFRREPVTAHVIVVAPLFSLFPDAGLPPGSIGPDNPLPPPSTAGGPVGYPPGTPAGPAVRLIPVGAEAAHRVPEVNGQPITAGQLRELLETIDALCPGGLQPPAGGTLSFALVDPVDGRLRATVGRRELERLARRGCPEHPDGDCGCPVLDLPGPVDRYRPTPAQRRFVTTRDRTCRHPGCANRAGWADLDHVVAHAEGGQTRCENLCCLCRRHHRLKTHAQGWIYTMSDDGVLTVTTPSGVTRSTRPPGYAEQADLLPGDDPPPF